MLYALVGTEISTNESKRNGIFWYHIITQKLPKILNHYAQSELYNHELLSPHATSVLNKLNNAHLLVRVLHSW